MQTYIEQFFGKENILSIEAIAQAGSNRKYCRVLVGDESYIVCESSNTRENETFFYFTSFFQQHQAPVPQIIDISNDKKNYILKDAGRDCLLDKVIQFGYTNELKALYQHVLSQLLPMQLKGGQQLDFSKCHAMSLLDKHTVLADLNYFKYYFLDLQDIIYNKAKLNEEFDQLSAQVATIEPKCFMYRDFQGRNILVNEDKICFIDYQGGMRGPLQYDVASLLWQAKAKLPVSWKQSLYDDYKKHLAQHLSFNEYEFDLHYCQIVLIRLLQVLGAYGLRGMIEKRPHFLSSIPEGLRNLGEWINLYSLDLYPELLHVLKQLSSDDFIGTYQPVKTNEGSISQAPALKVSVQSFSYKKGIPTDNSGNGGGYVFDCRGILNPGRFEAYKKLTGRDLAVIEFLESKTQVGKFLEHAKQLVDINVQDYLERSFEHLMISFGCTGGQHRSVYCADAMAAYLKAQYGIEVSTTHIEQEAKGWVNG